MTPAQECGMILCLAVIVASIGGVFYLSMGDQDPDHVESIINVERFDMTLVSDEENARIVMCDFLFSIDQRVPVTVGGDIANATIPKGAFYSAGEATVVRGTSLFVLNEPAAPGDEVEILIRHGASETSVVVEVGGS